MIKNLLSLLLIFMMGCTSAQVSKKDLDKEEYYILRGLNLYQEGNLTEALGELEKAFVKNNKNPITLRELGLIYGELGNIEKSKSYYEKAYRLDERDEISLKNLALINYEEGNYKKARKYIDLVTRDNIDILTIKLKGLLLAREGKEDEAYGYLAEVLAYDKLLDLEVYMISQEILLKQDSKEELYRLIEDGYIKHKNEEDYILYYSKTLIEVYGEIDKSSTVLKRYLASNGGSDLIYLQLAKVSLYEKDRKGAEVALKMVSDRYRYDNEYLSIMRELKR